MKKCSFCGTEFEGNFCPNCGEKWQEVLVCTHCGANIVSGAKFCTECGSPIYPDMSDTNQSTKDPLIKTLIRRIAQFLPDLLLLLFSLASFLFYLAPVAVMPGGEFLGEKIPSQSYGNLYQFIKLNGEIFVPFLILIIITAFSAVFSAICLFSSKKRLFCSVIRYFLYLFFIIFASVMIITVKKTDEGSGLIQAGSCFILILVFAILFCAISLVIEPFKEKNYKPASLCLTISKSDSEIISAYAYAERKDLYSVKIGNGIKRIEREAFRDCIELCSVSVGADMTVIEDNAFLGCVSLRQINFPVSLREIGWYALCNCINLEKIIYSGTQEQWEHLSKGDMWDDKSGEYIIVCNDGVLQKRR